VLQAQLANCLSCLLLVTTVNGDCCTSWDVGFALSSSFGFGVGGAVDIFGCGLLRGLVIGELFYPRVRHDGGGCRGGTGTDRLFVSYDADVMSLSDGLPALCSSNDALGLRSAEFH
jgi:hypothetical protein